MVFIMPNLDPNYPHLTLPKNAHGSLGITQGHFDCVFSFVEIRIASFECSSIFVDGDIFENAPRVDADIFLIRIKKDAFSKITGYVWKRPQKRVADFRLVNFKRDMFCLRKLMCPPVQLVKAHVPVRASTPKHHCT